MFFKVALSRLHVFVLQRLLPLDNQAHTSCLPACLTEGGVLVLQQLCVSCVCACGLSTSRRAGQSHICRAIRQAGKAITTRVFLVTL